MRALHVTQLEICPWALREGVICHRLDTLDGRMPHAPLHDGRTPAVRFPATG